jgi:diguanylate cyclase (GGDEF)-like protein
MSTPERSDSEESRLEYFRRNFTTYDELLAQTVLLEGFAKAALQKNQANRARANLDATHDDLTGILNRRGLRQAFNDRKVHRSRKEDLAKPDLVAIIDLDKFKEINDTYGHKGGDMALQSIAELLSTSKRDGTLYGRLGGDEFLAFLHNTTLDEGLGWGQRIQTYIARFNEAAKLDVPLPTVSIGIAEIDYSLPFDEMYHSADVPMYAAKEAGRNQVHILQPGL